MKKTRILIADDHEFLRIGLASLIDCESDFELVGEAENGSQAVAKAMELLPDVIVMDLMMPELNGDEAVRRILDANPPVVPKIIIITSYAESSELFRAVRNGAVGVIEKNAAADQLVKTIRTVLEGRTSIPRRVRVLLKESAGLPELTERQLTILGYAARGLTNQDIMTLLDISENGVKKQLMAIYAKIGASNRSEAVAIALRERLLKI